MIISKSNGPFPILAVDKSSRKTTHRHLIEAIFLDETYTTLLLCVLSDNIPQVQHCILTSDTLNNLI